ncbi:MAG: hypothetical protein KIC80_01060 [Brachyspira sp.]|nr:hypothetical protein [Brachyspira sp.]
MNFDIVKTFYSSKNKCAYQLLRMEMDNSSILRLYKKAPQNSKYKPVLDKFYLNLGEDNITSIERARVTPILKRHIQTSVILKKGKDIVGYGIANKRGKIITSSMKDENGKPYIFQETKNIKTKNNAPMAVKLIQKALDTIAKNNQPYIHY